MPALMDVVLETDGPAPFPRKRWTLRECERLINEGLLDGASYELIEGDIVSKMGQGRLHVIVVTRLLAALGVIFGIDCLQTQASVGIGEIQEISDPEPDVAVLREPVQSYATAAPDPAQDVSLVVEAASTSLRGDISVKARLYARAGIPEYWIVDINGRRLLVFREPDAARAEYGESYSLSETEQVSPLAAPAAAIRVSDLLP